ncbi:MAG: DUF4097 domain-containing protein [Ruminococcaceae bacterium]|nr:DUF4097 domain-containing protein [Oscillospiraceae bacterium]
MKKLFFAAIPICLVSFVLFGISVAILDVRYRSHYDTPTSGYYAEVMEGSTTYIEEKVTSSGEWTLEGAVRPAVNLRTSGINAYVVQSSDENVHIRATTNSDSSVYVNAYTDGDELNIEVCPPNIVFDGSLDFGKIFWLDDIFHGSPNTEVIIAFPKLIYDELNIEHGSGTLMVDGFNAKINDFDIGSGRFEFSKSEQFTADVFDVDIGSGTSIISNMQTRRYRIDIGSGHYNFSGLSGFGEIVVGSGSGKIAYSSFTYGEYDDDEASSLDIGSGSLDLFFPDDESCRLYADIGSGSINVNAYGIEKKLTSRSDGDELVLGNDNYQFYYINMGSGKVNIYNTSEYVHPTMFENRPEFVTNLKISGIVISTESGDAVVFSSSSSMNAAVELYPDYGFEVTGITEQTDNASGEFSNEIASIPVDGNSVVAAPTIPEAPSAPAAPSAPSAPEAPEF